LVYLGELKTHSKIDNVALDMLRTGASLTAQPSMVKVFKLLKVEKGSARSALSLAQKAKFVRSKLVNSGKFKDFGNNIFPKL